MTPENTALQTRIYTGKNTNIGSTPRFKNVFEKELAREVAVAAHIK